MSLRREFETLLSEFLPDEEQMEAEIQKEWDRMLRRGEKIRVGDASRSAHRRWLMKHGADLLAALKRKQQEEQQEE